MKRWRVAFTQGANITRVVEAESATAAREKAAIDGAFEGLCHQCAKEIDLDSMGWEPVAELPEEEL